MLPKALLEISCTLVEFSSFLGLFFVLRMILFYHPTDYVRCQPPPRWALPTSLLPRAQGLHPFVHSVQNSCLLIAITRTAAAEEEAALVFTRTPTPSPALQQSPTAAPCPRVLTIALKCSTGTHQIRTHAQSAVNAQRCTGTEHQSVHTRAIPSGRAASFCPLCLVSRSLHNSANCSRHDVSQIEAW